MGFRNHRAFTLAQMLVAIGVIGTLMGLVLNALNSSREKARKGICLSNMRQAGLAITAFESKSSSSIYPGYKMYLRLYDGTSYKARGAPYPQSEIGTEKAITWLVELFPYLYGDHWYSDMKKPISSTLTNPLYPYIDMLVCPSDPPSGTDRAPISIVVNSGMRDSKTVGQRDYRANGVFHDHYTDNIALASNKHLTTNRFETVTSAFIDREGDGLQHTLMLSENVDAGSYLDTDERFIGFTWAAPTSVNTRSKPYEATLPDKLYRINQQKGRQLSAIEDPSTHSSSGSRTYEDDSAPFYYYARPSSNHPNGVNVVFCDAHGMFLSDRIDYYVYTLLMTPDGKNVQDPSSGDKIPLDGYSGTNVGPPKLDDAWIRK